MAFALVPVSLLFIVFIWLMGASNPSTPAGYVGYLTKGSVLGKARFYGVQRGPVSAGRTWLLQVTNISVTPYTYSESFTGDDAVLSRDNLKIAFGVHTVWRVDESRVPMFMPNHTVVYIPVGPMGVPLTGTFPASAGRQEPPMAPAAVKK